jgi:hypothetical protein
MFVKIMKNVFLYQAMMRGKNILKFAPKVENLDLSNNGMQTIPFGKAFKLKIGHVDFSEIYSVCYSYIRYNSRPHNM